MLDLNYMNEVVKLAHGSDSNALAEIYAATCKKQYAFALGFLEDEFAAQDAMQETYTNVFTGISRIEDGQMAVSFITLSTLHACLNLRGSAPENMSVTIEGTEYTVRRIMRLTLSQSVCLLLRYMCGMSIRQLASLMEIRAGVARRYIKSGLEALNEKV